MIATSLLEALFILPFMGILTKQGLVAFYSAQTLLTTDEKCIMPTSVCIKHQGTSQPSSCRDLPSCLPQKIAGHGGGGRVWCSVCCSLGDVCLSLVSWVFIQLDLKTIIFIFAIKYAKSQGTQETLK